jgi:PTH1 family peptidyl-tRNA hydrolase
VPIKLIVGLGNPGPEYAETRHNVGVWLVQQIAHYYKAPLRHESKFKGLIDRIRIDDHECWLLIPTTFMNHSGQAVKALSHFYKIAPEEIVIAHDELDFPAGVIRIKKGGGDGGHNGVSDVIDNLASKDFYRLRIGISHPGNRDQVLDYVLHHPNQSDKKLIKNSIDDAMPLLSDMVQGNWEKVMQELHTKL